MGLVAIDLYTELSELLGDFLIGIPANRAGALGHCHGEDADGQDGHQSGQRQGKAFHGNLRRMNHRGRFKYYLL